VGSITSGQTSITVSNTVGLPVQFPYTLALDYESPTEELVDVTAAAGPVLTVTRGVDGTSAASHADNARVRHTSSGRDFADSRNHENSANGVHGLSGGEDIVGTTKVQTLTNKTVVDLQGSLLNPDINLTGANVINTVRTPAGAGSSLWLDFTNGTDQVLALQNDGQIKVRNTVAMDTATTTRRLSLVMSDGTTERLYLTTTGMAVSIPRSGTADTEGGLKVLDPGDSVTRKLIQVRNSADTTDKFVVSGGGGVNVTVSDNNTTGITVKGPAAPAVDLFRVTDSADVPLVHVDTAGELNAMRRMDIFNDDLPGSPTLQVKANATQSVSIQTWETSTGSDIARIRNDGSADFTSVVTTTGIVTAAAGWSVSAQIAVVKAGIATILLRMLRTGASIVADPGGDLFGDPALGTISAAFRPHSAFGANPMVFQVSQTTANGNMQLIPSTGDMNIQSWSTDNQINTGVEVRVTMTYPLNFT
jgi:hypothetical protein